MGLFNLILQGIISGVVTGCVYALVALSLVIVYKATDVVNFAGGELVMIGAYIGLLLLMWLDWPYVVIFLITPVFTYALGVLFSRFALEKINRKKTTSSTVLVSFVIATIALSNMLKGIVRVIPFTEEVRRLPPLFSGPPLFLGDLVIQPQDIVIVVVASLVMLMLWVLFGYTMVGKALRATSQNERAASLIGIPVKSVKSAIWGLSAMVASIAGLLLAPKLLMTPDMGNMVMLAFAAAIIGGFSSLPGCVVGGILLGIVQNMVGIFISPQAIAVTPFFVIMLVLLIRPQGFFDKTLAYKKV